MVQLGLLFAAAGGGVRGNPHQASFWIFFVGSIPVIVIICIFVKRRADKDSAQRDDAPHKH
jgi:hypothetical protein